MKNSGKNISYAELTSLFSHAIADLIQPILFELLALKDTESTITYIAVLSDKYDDISMKFRFCMQLPF